MPLVASYSLGISDTSEVLPEPVAPIMPIVSPSAICKLISVSTVLSDFCEYAKATFSKSILPFFTSVKGCSGRESVGFSFKTSQILSIEPFDSEMKLRHIATIIIPESICAEYWISV